MKKIILLLAVVLSLGLTLPQFFYYSSTRNAIAIRDSQSGSLLIKNYYGQAIMKAEYPANRSWWISVSRLAPGLYTATTNDGIILNFYKRP